MVVHLLHTETVTGSSPVITTKFRIATANIKNLFLKKSQKMLSCFIVGALCNGSTTDFDSVSLGSIPNAPANFYLSKVLSGCIRGLGPCGPGSNPGRETKFYGVSSVVVCTLLCESDSMGSFPI